MSSLTGRGERFPASVRGTHWSSEVQHHCEPVCFSASINGKDYQPKERLTPEGAGGTRGDPHRNMCQRADAVPSYKSLPGAVGDRIRSTMSFGSGTICRGGMSENPGFGRSERKVACCEKCSATLVALKKQALSLAVHHHFSCKDTSDLSAFLHDNLRVHSRSTTESRDRDREQGECGTCGINLNQLKQEAIHLALSRALALVHCWDKVRQSMETELQGKLSRLCTNRAVAPTVLTAREARGRLRGPLKHSDGGGPKLPNPDMDRWVEEQQQMVASKSVSSTDRVSIYPHHQAADAAALSCCDAGIVQTNSKIPHISRVVTIANTAAMSLLARAAEKLNLTSRKKGQASDPAPAHLSTCFRELIQNNPPPVPSCLLQAATRTKDSPNVGKVKVVLRVSPTLSECQRQPPVLRTDPSKKRVTVMEPISQSKSYSTMTLDRAGKYFLKTFSFDAAYPQESSQAEVCAGVLPDVIRCVLSGSDGCVLGLGCADVGSWSSMVGSGESIQKLGLIPCAISWLYSAIERRREKTWTDLTVSVSAIELCCGEEDTLRDLLGEVVPSAGSIQDSPKAHVRLQEDPVYGIQLRNHNRVKAPTAERAGSLLDAAIAARRHNDFITYLSDSSIMFFTLHVQPPRTESSTIGKGSRGPTKLTLIDVCSGIRGMTKNKPPYSELGPVVVSLLSGHKPTPNKGSKLTMLLRESLGHVNCHTTVIAQVADSVAYLQETLSTIQLASRIRRTQKRTKQSTSCSPSGRSLTKDYGRGPHCLSLRAFHSTEEVDVDIPRFRLRGELDERSSSDQSCDTVIQLDSDGLVQSKTTSRLTQPEFVPIIPSLHPNKADMDDPEFTALLQELLRIPKLQGEKKNEETAQGNTEVLKADMKKPGRDCLKCDTFAELQERLGCIDGSEITMDMLKSTFNGLPVNKVPTKSQPQKDTGKKTNKDPSETPQTLLNQGIGCSQTSAGENQTDGAFPGDSFQREDSGLYDCEECSATSSSEELLNQTLSRNKTCRSEPPKSGTPKSDNNLSSRDFDVDARSMAVTSSLALQPTVKQECPEAADWFKPDKRTSPVGKSSPISPPSSCSSSHSLATSVILGDVLPNRPTEDIKEMKATITVTVQQPLDLKGQDELVFSMVEEVTISGELNRGRTGGNIICIRDTAQSQTHVQGSAGSQPIRIISNVSEESVATCSSNTNKCHVVQSVAKEASTEMPQCEFRKEKRSLPSFINVMLINTDMDCELNGATEKESPLDTVTGVKSKSELRGNKVKCPKDRKALEKRSGTFVSETHAKKYDKVCDPPYHPVVLEDSAFCDEPAENKMCGKRPRNTEKSHPRDKEHVYSTNTPKASEGGEVCSRRVGNAPKGIGVSPGCQETTPASFKTGSLPRGWQNANHQDSYYGGYMADGHRDPRGVTSSTSCSPGVTLERRQGRQHSLENHSLHVSSPRKYGTDYKQHASSATRKSVESLFETSSPRMKHDHMSARLKSPSEHSSRLFNAKLEQLAIRTNSLGRTPKNFPTLDRDSSNTSVSSKGSSKGSVEWSSKGDYKGHNGGDCTLPRASRSPRKNPRSEQSCHFFASEDSLTQSARHTHSKLSAVGKLKMASPKVRRLSAPSIKNLNLPHKGLRQSINRSASLSPDCKTVSFERTSSFLSSSPPRSFHSISRTPSQSSTCSSTKSVIQGFVNGRISDLLKERASSPTSAGLDQITTIPSPYSQVTAPRTPDHLSGHASDTTSVLSGDLPPAMGKTSLNFSNRSSTVSSGYDSMMRDSEATGSSISTRDSVSDRSGSLLSVARSSRSSRRRGNTGTHQRRVSHDTPLSLRRSASGLRSRWVGDRGIAESYEIKVYEIDNVQRMQKRAGAGKQGPACFNAKLKFLEHRQQRILAVRAKYNNLRRELEQVKHNLMLEPAKWNQEFDLWQTFEVDSLEHLEALEVVTARLEDKVNVSKANVMMVTCFDTSTRKRHKKRRRRAPEQRALKAI
ncbi:Kinesin-like protein KIF26B [Collichthys lucidus]|uniref:Kinesin-like protein KIF26B n=1 Tax=Collichthys lucidus TaxID=240159 RepID=A0A4V6AP93_COLLU|nr:Kinesin-like protein KIF26B [Collichthys lucidus]